MDLLITLIGDAAVDPGFRKRFLDKPANTADLYGFRFTKGEFELMQTVFANLKPEERDKLEQAFSTLENILYAKITPPCTHPCVWSIYPPPELRAGPTQAEKVTEIKRRTGTK